MENIVSLLLIGCWIAVVITTAIYFRKKFPNKKELVRKIVHIGNGPVVPLAWLLKIPQNLALTFSILITLALLINQKFRFISVLEDIDRKSFGTVGYGISITILLYFLWPNYGIAASSGMLVMALGDGLAGLIGSSIKSYSWQIFGQKKSILGTSTMFLVTLITLSIINIYGGSPINFIEIFAISTLAIVFEQFGQWGIDNITVPLVVAFSWVFFQVT